MDLISCLQVRKAHFPNTDRIIQNLVETMMKKTSMVNHTIITTLLDYCWQTNNANLCTTLCWRFLDNNFLTAENITQVLLPLIPELVKFVARRHLALTDDPFRTVFKNVLFAWASKVLGAKPPSASAHLALVQKNACSCPECRQVVSFLTGGTTTDRALNLARIGAPKRKHVEGQLAAYGGATVASWTMIRTTPQGLTVSAITRFIPVASLLIIRFCADHEK